MRLAGAGAAVVTCVVLAWFARDLVVDVLAVALGVAGLIGLVWVLIVSEELRRGVGLLVLGPAKLTWLMVRGLGALAIGLFSLISKRR